MNLAACPACLKPGPRSFCSACRRELFDGARVDHVLPFSRPDYNRVKVSQEQRISISGVQTKHSLKLEDGRLSLTERGGTHILKPIFAGPFQNLDLLPANEHLTMQIARRAFGIRTALSALVFFEDGEEPAFLTKRFDVRPDGSRALQEDMAQVAQMSEETHGRNYKYDYSYEEIAGLLERAVSAYRIEVERFFKLVVFNYLVNNGDAHLKNFSIYRDPSAGIYTLTPAYDLLNTRLHLPNENAMALDLFRGDCQTESYERAGFHTRDDLVELGTRIGIVRSRIERVIDAMASEAPKADRLIECSFLGERQAEEYLTMLADRRRALTYSPRV